MLRQTLLIILLFCAALAWANNDSTALQPEKTPVFQGCSGGMMVHAGYLFGRPAGAILPTGENISPQGMTYGLGGSMRVNLWKYLRVGMEGFSSNLKTGVSDQHDFLQKGSYIRTGWGGVIADACWRLEKVWPFIGGSVGGGAMRTLSVVEGNQDDWVSEQTAILHKQGFGYVNPYIGLDYCITKRIHATFRLDWMLAFAKQHAAPIDSNQHFSSLLQSSNSLFSPSSPLVLPTGPRLYIGIMFCH